MKGRFHRCGQDHRYLERQRGTLFLTDHRDAPEMQVGLLRCWGRTASPGVGGDQEITPQRASWRHQAGSGQRGGR
jgi:hypothetical protein